MTARAVTTDQFAILLEGDPSPWDHWKGGARICGGYEDLELSRATRVADADATVRLDRLVGSIVNIHREALTNNGDAQPDGATRWACLLKRFAAAEHDANSHDLARDRITLVPIKVDAADPQWQR